MNFPGVFDLNTDKNCTDLGRSNTPLESDRDKNTEELVESEHTRSISTIASSMQGHQPKFFQQLSLGYLNRQRLIQQKSLVEDQPETKKFLEVENNLNNTFGESRPPKRLEKKESRVKTKPTDRNHIAGEKEILIPLQLRTLSVPKEPRELQISTFSKEETNTPTLRRMLSRRNGVYARIIKGGWKQVVNSLLAHKPDVKSVFHRILKKEIPLSKAEYEFLGDKTYVIDENMIRNKNNRSGSKKKPRLRMLLEKHAFVRKDIKTDFVKRLLKRIEEKKKTKFQLGIETILKFKRRLFHIIGIFLHRCLEPLHPVSMKRIVWDCISVACTLYEVVFIPFYIAYDFEQPKLMATFELFKDIFFCLEVLLNFHTGYQVDGVYIMDHKKIAKKYFRTWFPLDLIANFPYTQIIIFSLEGYSAVLDDAYSGTLKYSRLLKLLRIIKWAKIKKILSNFQNRVHSQVFVGLINLFTLSFYIILLAHWIACIWHLVGKLNEDDLDINSSWLVKQDLGSEGVTGRYVASLFWAITTMLTVGYGDITPVNMTERLVNIFAMLVGCAMFAYSMNSVGILLQNINAEVSKKRHKYQLITKFMKRKNVPKEMQNKVQKYLDYLFQNNNEKITEEEGALYLLSESLQDELRKEINGRVLRENVVFQVLYGTKFLSLLSKNLEGKIFSPNEIIFDESDTDFGMYFISAGSIELYFSHPKKAIKTLEKDEHFGEISFFTDRPRTAAARSITFSSLFFLKKTQFLALLEDHEVEKETYHQIKDNIMLYENYEALKLYCFACGEEGHYLKICPNIHYKLNTEEINQRYIHKHRRFCQNFHRNSDNRRFKALSKMKHVQACANQIYKDQFDIIKELINVQVPSVKSLVMKMQRSSFLEKANNQNTTNAGATVLDLRKIAPEPPMFADLFQLGDTYQIPSIAQSKLKNVSNADIVLYKGEQSFRPHEVSLDNDIENYTDALFRSKRSSSFSKYSNYKLSKISKGVVYMGGFDAVKNYELYFPHNNIKKIISQLENHKKKMDKIREIQNHIEDVKSEVSKFNRKVSVHTPRKDPTAKKRERSYLFPNSEI